MDSLIERKTGTRNPKEFELHELQQNEAVFYVVLVTHKGSEETIISRRFEDKKTAIDKLHEWYLIGC